jgi:hypothetical protein
MGILLIEVYFYKLFLKNIKRFYKVSPFKIALILILHKIAFD